MLRDTAAFSWNDNGVGGIKVPSDCIGYITGSRRATLGRMEEEFLGWFETW